MVLNFREFHSSYPAHLDHTHGTIENAYNHKNMMEIIANDIVDQAIEKYDDQIKERIETTVKESNEQAYRQAINDFMEALHYDIESVVEIGLDGCETIFKDKRTQRVISDRIIQEIKKRLNSK